MEIKNILAFIIIEVTTLVMAFAWFQRFVPNPYNIVIIFCLLVIVGIAILAVLSINTRLREMEKKMESRDKAIRISIMTVEADIEGQLSRLNDNVEKAVSEINKKRFI
jgi:predicted PurR-regulated permease PerM